MPPKKKYQKKEVPLTPGTIRTLVADPDFIDGDADDPPEVEVAEADTDTTMAPLSASTMDALSEMVEVDDHDMDHDLFSKERDELDKEKDPDFVPSASSTEDSDTPIIVDTVAVASSARRSLIMSTPAPSTSKGKRRADSPVPSRVAMSSYTPKPKSRVLATPGATPLRWTPQSLSQKRTRRMSDTDSGHPPLSLVTKLPLLPILDGGRGKGGSKNRLWCFFRVDDRKIANQETGVGEIDELGAKCQIVVGGRMCPHRSLTKLANTAGLATHLQSKHKAEYAHYKAMKEFDKAEANKVVDLYHHVLDLSQGVPGKLLFMKLLYIKL